MKHRIASLFLVACLLLTCLSGCHQKHTWIEATCTEPKTCPECGKTEGEALGHTMAEATCTKPATCTVCGATEGAALGHKAAEATCTEPSVCSVCGETLAEALGHTLSEPTHLVPATCSVCGATEGSVIPYAEEFGLHFTTDRDYISPLYAYLSYDGKSDDREQIKEEEGITIAAEDGNYHLEDVTVSEPDAAGNVQVTITYTHAAKIHLEYDGVKRGGAFHYGWRYDSISLFDYYSGNTLMMESRFVGDEDVTITTELEYDGKTTAVDYTSHSEKVSAGDVGSWTKRDDGSFETAIEPVSRFILTVTMPQDYDGLCMSLSKLGTTKMRDFDEENSNLKSKPLLESYKDGETVDDLYLVRVKDLIG